MSLTAYGLFYSDRRKLFMISLQNMCKNLESNVFGLRRPKMSLTAITSFESASRKFFMNPTYIIARK